MMDFENYPIEFDIKESAILAVKDRYGSLVGMEVSGETLPSMKDAVRECRTLRGKIEARRKELKAPLLQLGRRIDGMAKELTAAVKEVEGPIYTKVRSFEMAEKKAKEEAARKERERIDSINARIISYRNLPANLPTMSIKQAKDAITALKSDDFAWADEFRESFLEEKDSLVKKSEEYLSFLEEKNKKEREESEKAWQEALDGVVEALSPYCRSKKKAMELIHAIKSGKINGLKISI